VTFNLLSHFDWLYIAKTNKSYLDLVTGMVEWLTFFSLSKIYLCGEEHTCLYFLSVVHCPCLWGTHSLLISFALYFLLCILRSYFFESLCHILLCSANVNTECSAWLIHSIIICWKLPYCPLLPSAFPDSEHWLSTFLSHTFIPFQIGFP
jgi:hypothetical protein